MALGVVRWFNSEKGFGFITPDDGGADIFVNFSEIAVNGFKFLTENQRVEYEHGPGQSGRIRPFTQKGLQARNVRIL